MQFLIKTSKYPYEIEIILFFFFFFFAAPSIQKFQDQGSNLSCSCNLCHSFSNAGSLNHGQAGNQIYTTTETMVDH